MTRLYFAYGSNLLAARLQRRCPGARLLGPARWPGRRLAFHKLGIDGSGKCDAPAAFDPLDPSGAVLGALVALDGADAARLDALETGRFGYHLHPVRVRHGGRWREAVTYLADAAAIDPGLLPFHWYRSLVLAGARELGLPAAYRRAIAAVPARRDPDRGRAARELAPLTETGQNVPGPPYFQ